MPRDDNFMSEYFKQSQERMRHTSDTELRLLWFLLLFFPIIGVMMATLYGSEIERTAYLFLSIGVSVVFLIVTLFMDIKIRAEHNTYREIGQSVKKVWRYFQLSDEGAYLEKERIIPEEEVVPDPHKGYGAGKGYRRTIYIVWTLTVAMIGVIITLGVLKFTSEVPEPTSSLIHTTFGV